MQKDNHNHKYKYMFIFILVAVFFLVFLLNRFTLYTSDDFTYHFLYRQPFPDGHEQPIRNIFDLLLSQINHWRVWNGRFTGHTIVQVFMQFDKIVFDVINSVVFVTLCLLLDHLSSRFSTGSKIRYKSFYLIVIFLLLWWFLPEIGKTVLWVSGSGNYLWTAVLDLVWLSLIFKQKRFPYLLLLTIPLAFFVGAGNENTSPAIIMLVGLFSLYDWFIENRFPIERVLEIVFASGGFFLMLLSPGSQKRAGAISVFDGLYDKLHNLFQLSWGRYGVLYISLLLLVVYALFRKYLRKEQILAISFILMAHLACIYSLVVSNELPERIFFGASVLLILALLIPLKVIFVEEKKWVRGIAVYALLPVVIKFGMSYSNALSDVHDTYLAVKEQYEEVRLAKEKGQEFVTLRRYTEPRTLFNAYKGTANLGPSKDDWFNQWMAAYFEIEGIESTD